MTEGRDFPLRAVSESTGFVVKVETMEGDLYLGKLCRIDMELGDVELTNVRCHKRDSSLSVEERVFIKGINVRILHLPTEIKKASFLEWRNPLTQKTLKQSLKIRRYKRHVLPKPTGKKSKETKQQKLKKLV